MAHNSPKIFVTGATGTVGSELVKQLSAGGVPVRVGVHSPGKADRLKALNVETAVIDLATGSGLEQALKGIEKIFLLIPPSPDMEKMTQNVVDAALRTGVKQIVKLSSLGTGADSQYSLGKLHYRAEQIIEKSGIAYTFLRPNFFMQNFINFHGSSIRERGQILFQGGDSGGSFIDVRDIASVALKTLTESGHEGKRYELTGPESLSWERAARILTEATGRKIEYVSLTEDQARQQMKESGIPDWFIEGLLELGRAFRKGHLAMVTGTLQEITGNPPHTFQQFVKDNIESFTKVPVSAR